MTSPGHRRSKHQRGVVLAVVLVLFVLLFATVAAFQRRAVIDVTVSRNRENAAIAEGLARGAARLGEAIVMRTVVAARMAALSAGHPEPTSLDQLWARAKDVEIPSPIGTGTLRVTIEDAGSRLNLNALAPAKADPESGEIVSEAADGAREFMAALLEKVIAEIAADATEAGEPTGDLNYDPTELANTLVDYLDSDEVDSDGRYEDEAYRDLDRPGRPANQPLLSVDELGRVPGFDRRLVDALRPYVTVYPLDGRSGINLNTAPSWVLALVYYGPSGDRQLANAEVVGDILKARKTGHLLCTQTEADPERCLPISEVGLGDGSIFPPADAPVTSSVFRVVGEATIGEVTRRVEAVYDYSEMFEPVVLSFRPLQGSD